MSNARKPHLSSAIRELMHLLVWCALVTGFAYGQAGLNQPEKAVGVSQKDQIADWIEKAREDNPESIYFVVRIADAGAVQAIPMLEEKFARTQDELDEAHISNGSVKLGDLDKAHIASALVRLGDKNDTYWNFLLKQATVAVESDIPEYLTYDAQGKSGAGPSPELATWAKSHNISPAAMEEEDLYMLPGAIGVLGMTGDRRAIPLLRQALLSPNYQIEIVAARGLANIQDKDSIPLIIEACKRASADSAAAIAKYLVYFDDADAQSMADRYAPKAMADAVRADRANGNTPFH